MAVRFPKYRPRQTEVIEFEDLNESIQAVVTEAAGRLNEHNFQNNTFNNYNSRRTQFTDGCAYRIKQTFVDATTGGTVVTINRGQAWIPLLETTIDMPRAGFLWILGSYAQSGTGAANDCALRTAISVNGELFSESVIGTLDNGGYYIGDLATQTGSIDTVQMLPAGTHTVQLLASVSSNTENLTVDYAVDSRELIVINLV